MDVVTKFCDEHDILYFLEAGTLLDDIDLGMLRLDYDKFMKLFNEGNTRYKFYCLENNPDFPCPFGKVFDTSTVLYEPDRKTGHKLAVNIDIWVMDNAPDEDKALRKMFIRQYLFRNLNFARSLSITTPPNGNLLHRIITRFALVLVHMIPASIMPKNYFAHKMLNNGRRYVSENTKRVGSFMGGHELVMDREKFSKFTYADFEGKKYKIPSGYDAWLSALYGDYMTPPPEDKRESTHQFESFINEA